MEKNEKWTLLKYHWDENADPCMVVDEVLEEHEVSDPTDILAIVTDYVAEHEPDATTYRWANTTGDPLDWEYYQGGFDAAFNSCAVYSMLPSRELEEIT